jgi:hypothetical protein
MRLDPLGQKLGQRPDELLLLLARHRQRDTRQEPQRRLAAGLRRAPASGRPDCLGVTSCQFRTPAEKEETAEKRRLMGALRTCSWQAPRALHAGGWRP